MSAISLEAKIGEMRRFLVGCIPEIWAWRKAPPSKPTEKNTVLAREKTPSPPSPHIQQVKPASRFAPPVRVYRDAIEAVDRKYLDLQTQRARVRILDPRNRDPWDKTPVRKIEHI